MAKRAEIAFRQEVAKALREAIRNRRLTVSAAAKLLGVSRQSLHSYLSGSTTPKSSIVNKACVKWGLSMNVYGKTFSAAAFETPKLSEQQRSVQLSFDDMLKSVGNHDLDIKLIRAEKGALELKVRIKFAS